VGEPTEDQKHKFTLVLKAHIAMATIRFPPGTSGMALDAIARAPMWNAGLDYDHGTGHGVGAYLSVHEGPARINKSDRIPLEPGMIVSNEPGYYRNGAWGIRIENLMVVTAPAAIAGGERPMLGFEPLTLAPLERALILRGRLSAAERAWVDGYHAEVLARLAPQLDGEVYRWLETQCAKL
jgi:Xaa-Pro aminopeptidase